MLLSGFKWLYEHSFTEPYDLLRNDIHLNIPTVRAIELEKIREVAKGLTREHSELCTYGLLYDASPTAIDDYRCEDCSCGAEAYNSTLSDLLKAIGGSE